MLQSLARLSEQCRRLSLTRGQYDLCTLDFVMRLVDVFHCQLPLRLCEAGRRLMIGRMTDVDPSQIRDLGCSARQQNICRTQISAAVSHPCRVAIRQYGHVSASISIIQGRRQELFLWQDNRSN